MIRFLRNTIFSLMLILICLLFSCEKLDEIINCAQCLDEEPLDTTLDIMVETDYSPFRETEITVYQGPIEDDIVLATQRIGQPRLTIKVPVNRMLTVTAKYFLPGKVIIATGCTTPKVRYSENACEDPCWYVYDRNVNLTLIYY